VPLQLPDDLLEALEVGKVLNQYPRWRIRNLRVRMPMQKLLFPANRREILSVTTAAFRGLASRVDNAKPNAVVTPRFVDNVEN